MFVQVRKNGKNHKKFKINNNNIDVSLHTILIVQGYDGKNMTEDSDREKI